MPFLTKLPTDAKVFDGFATWPAIYGPWTETCQQILRDAPSTLTAGERELIGTFVSRLNDCDYCYTTHNAASTEFGYAAGLVDDLKADIETAGVDEKLRPLLRYVRKLTLDQHRMVQADADAVYAAGWTEDDLHIAIAIAALFNFMNRFVHGLGIEADLEYAPLAGKRLAEHGYQGAKRKRDAEQAEAAAE